MTGFGWTRSTRTEGAKSTLTCLMIHILPVSGKELIPVTKKRYFLKSNTLWACDRFAWYRVGKKSSSSLNRCAQKLLNRADIVVGLQ
jgi:hypothetical protein